MGKLLKGFIEDWANTEKSADTHIHIMDVSRDDEVFNIELRYPPTRYKPINMDEFLDLKTAVRCSSSETLSFATDLADYNTGIISLRIASCNHGYNDKKIIRSIVKLTEKMPQFH